MQQQTLTRSLLDLANFASRIPKARHGALVGHFMDIHPEIKVSWSPAEINATVADHLAGGVQ